MSHAKTILVTVIRLPSWISPVIMALALSACGSDGGDSSGVPPAEGDVEAATTMSAVPGDVVTLQASAEDNDRQSMNYRWAQTGGLEVALADTDSAIAHFVMPPLPADTALDFEVSIKDDAGHATRQTVTVTAAAAWHRRSRVTSQFAVFTATKDSKIKDMRRELGRLKEFYDSLGREFPDDLMEHVD